jgi:hypothetical protein
MVKNGGIPISAARGRLGREVATLIDFLNLNVLFNLKQKLAQK